MSFDYSRLRGKIREKCGTQEAFSERMSMSPQTLSAKLNNNVEFSQSEIMNAVAILDIPISDFFDFFFKVSLEN